MIVPPADDSPSSPAPVLGGRIRRVVVASAVAQAIGELVSLVQTVVVARLLSPAEVGLFAAGTVLTAFLAEFQEGGLRSALVNRQTDVEEAAQTVFWATLINGTLMALGALVAAPIVGLIFHSATAGVIAAVSAGGLVVYSLINVPEAFLQREFSVRRRLIVGPLVALSFAAVTITLASLGFGVWSLLIGTYASYVAMAVAVWLLYPWRPGKALASYKLWRELAKFGSPRRRLVRHQDPPTRRGGGRRSVPQHSGSWLLPLRPADRPLLANALIEIVSMPFSPRSPASREPPLFGCVGPTCARWGG